MLPFSTWKMVVSIPVHHVGTGSANFSEEQEYYYFTNNKKEHIMRF